MFGFQPEEFFEAEEEAREDVHVDFGTAHAGAPPQPPAAPPPHRGAACRLAGCARRPVRRRPSVAAVQEPQQRVLIYDRIAANRRKTFCC